MTRSHIAKYLQNYAEPLIQSLVKKTDDCKALPINALLQPNVSSSNLSKKNNTNTLSSLNFDHVVVIPAYKESPKFIEHFLSSSLAQINVLVIIVINQPDNTLDNTPQITLDNYIKSTGECVYQQDKLSFISPNNANCCFCIVDAFNTPIPVEQGVGLARKLGTDLAVYLKNRNQISSDWIHSTDADAKLPDNYFSALETNEKANQKNCAAVSYNFSHFCENKEIHEANQAYEKALRYYVKAMEFAHSQYAFFTIGSVIAFKTFDYVKVRGFPKRSAGEDFYLLNKLAKLGHIGFIEESIVCIEARESNRVPFGTGPSVSKIVELNRNGLPYCYYNPQLFIELKACLTHFESLWDKRHEFTQWLSELTPQSQKALLENQFESFVNKQKNNNKVQFYKQLLVWFDAFKTLKYLHNLRDNVYPDVPLSDALNSWILKCTNQ